MKKYFVFVFLGLLLLASLVSADSTVNFPGNLLKITLLDQDPDPVRPGEAFDVKVRVQAVRTDARNNNFHNLNIKLLEDDVFSLVNGDAVRELGTLRESEVIDVVYRLVIASNAPDGVHRLRFAYSADEQPAELESSGYLSVDARAVETTLAITSVESFPSRISPGEEAVLNVTLQNGATSSMRDLRIALDFRSVPFTPLTTTAEKQLRQLNPGESVSVDFKVIADVDAESKPYGVPVKISYLDDKNNKFRKNDTVGLLVYAKPILEYNVESTEVVQKGQTGEVVISVSNIGPSEVKFITLSLLDAEGYKVVSTEKSYLGNLDPDDFQTAAFTVYVHQDVPTLHLQSSYKDAYNQEIIKGVELPLKVFDKRTATAYGLVKRSGGIFSLIFWILLIAFVLYSIKEWRHHKSLEKGIYHGLRRTIRLVIKVIFWFRWRNLKQIPQKIKRLAKE